MTVVAGHEREHEHQLPRSPDHVVKGDFAGGHENSPSTVFAASYYGTGGHLSRVGEVRSTKFPCCCFKVRAVVAAGDAVVEGR